MTVIVYGINSSAYYIFLGISTDLLINKFFLSYKDAKNIIGLIPIASLIGSLLISSFAIKYGKKGILVLVSNITSLLCFLTMLFLPGNPNKIILSVLIGLFGIHSGISLVVILSCVVLSCPKQVVPIVTGISVSLMYFGGAVGPVILGYITRARDVRSYNNALLFFIFLNGISSLLSYRSMVLDFKRYKVFHLPESHELVDEIRNYWSEELYRKMNHKL